MPDHGGQLQMAAAQYAIPLERWLDLSTGINPVGWTIPALPTGLWTRLPEEQDGLEAAASTYYGATPLLAVAGSQAAIQALPFLRRQSAVHVLTPGYAEHAFCWQRLGHTVTPVAADAVNAAAAHGDVLVLIHPNNPTGQTFPTAQLLAWHAELAAGGGWLVVDEAFMDATPERSLLPFTPRPGLIVLRSLGKFFGLAGLRVGFVAATEDVLSGLSAHLGPWPIATPSRWIARSALADHDWHARTRRALGERSARLCALLESCGLPPSGGTALFQWVRSARAQSIHVRLAEQGILTRVFGEPASLRFGLPAVEADWHRLQMALDELR